MLVPALSRPRNLRLSIGSMERMAEQLRPMADPIRSRKAKHLTAQPEFWCMACLKGKHNCVSRRCVCDRCRIA